MCEYTSHDFLYVPSLSTYLTLPLPLEGGAGSGKFLMLVLKHIQGYHIKLKKGSHISCSPLLHGSVYLNFTFHNLYHCNMYSRAALDLVLQELLLILSCCAADDLSALFCKPGQHISAYLQLYFLVKEVCC